jgi:alpha-L-rhamnosidase
MELVPESDKEQLIQNLLAKIDSAEYHFDAGVGGVKSLYESLDATGNNAIIYQMVNQTDFPSYGYWIEQGANTLWQDWDGSMSLNHVMFGSVSEWFFQSLAGINPDPQQPGFKNILLKPNFIDDLEWARADFESVHGKIISGWERKDDTVEMRIHIPVNSTATMHVPAGWKTVDCKLPGAENSQFSIPSGNYVLEFRKL